MTDMDSLISKRLTAIEDDLLEAITDRPSLAAFDSRWSSLVDDVKEAIAADALSIRTVHLAHGLSEKVADVVETFLNLDALSDQILSSLVIDASSILSSRPNLPTSSTSRSPSPDAFDIPKPTTSASLPPYVEPSYQWLLKNIHNPYPAAHVRNRIAQDTGCKRKDVDGWFIDTRKRVGWNALRKSHFSNKRVEIVDAAMRFFAEADPKRPLDPQVSYAFAHIETCMKSLYFEKLSKSDLATKLDMVVKDMTPEMMLQAKAEEQRQRSREKGEVLIIRDVHTYPTPDCSPIDTSPSLPSVDEDGLESNVFQSSGQSKRKRCAGSPDHLEKNFGISDRLMKRPRNSSPSLTRHSSYVLGLPSPAFSTHGPLTAIEDVSTSKITVPPTAVNSSSRKRRLSDPDSRGALKRPHIVPNVPKPRPNSDPLPLENALLDMAQLDDWFHNHTDFPNISNVEASPSTPLEVELYDFSQLCDQTQLTNIFQYPSPHIQEFDRLSPVLEISQTRSLDLDISTNTFNYEELFLSDDHSHEDRGHESSFSEMPSPVVPFSSDFLNIYKSSSHTNDPAFIVDTSSPVSDNPTMNFDWVFPSYISQTNVPEDECQDLLNLSHMGVFAPLMNSTSLDDSHAQNLPAQRRLSTQAERAAKQQKLFEVKETARRLEAELAASSC